MGHMLRTGEEEPASHTDRPSAMGLALVLWLCSLVPVGLLVWPLLGGVAAGAVALALLLGFVALCWTTCLVRRPLGRRAWECTLSEQRSSGGLHRETFVMTRRPRLERLALHALLGGLTGYLVLHPSSLLLSHVGLDRHYLHWDLVPGAFQAEHLTMALHFAVLGVLFGATIGVYADRLRAQQARIAMLEGLLPICSGCKRIWDGPGSSDAEGSWVEMDSYLTDHSHVVFSHGLCPSCMLRLYPEYADEALAEE